MSFAAHEVLESWFARWQNGVVVTGKAPERGRMTAAERVRKQLWNDHHTIAPMPIENNHILDAPPRLFDDMADILDASDFSWFQTSRESATKGVRRHDTAGYDVTLDRTTVHIAIERRLGNPKAFVVIIPRRRSFWRRDEPSEQLAERVAAMLRTPKFRNLAVS